MYRATSILTALFFVSGLGAGKTSFESETTSSVATETRASSPIETSQGRNLLRQLAIALAAGGEALSQFRGPTMKTEAGENVFNPAMPGMDCSVNGIANYVSCYGSAIGNAEEADRRFIRLIHELQAVLPSDRWKGMETEPGIDAIRSYTYEDQNSDAHIDIDLITIMETEGDPTYRVAIFGWPATEPRL
jgi:hypothetical protein